MASVPTATEPDATTTMPLPNRRRARQFVVLYILLALGAVVIGIAIGVHRHNGVTIGTVAVPTEQPVIATAPPGLPTPTPLATRAPAPTAAPPTEVPPTVSPPTAAPPTPIPPTTPAIAAPLRSAPTANVNQNREGNGNGNGRGKGKGKGGDNGD